MKVLHVISSSGLYGAEAVILNLLRTFAGGPDKAALAVFADPAQTPPQLLTLARERGFEAHALACRRQLDVSVPGLLRGLLRETGATLVHAHGYKADAYAYWALGRSGVPLVSTCHTWYDNDRAVRLYGALDRRILRNYQRVVAVSDDVRQRLLASGVEGPRIVLIRNGVDLASFTPRAWSDEPDTMRFGLVGRLAPEKGVDIFLRAAARVRGHWPSARFAVAGEGPDRLRLEVLVRELALGDCVALPGRQEDMHAFYASLDVLVSASRHEGLPVALLEGMASGLPLVATSAGAVPLLVRQGVTGLLVPVEDVEALADAMLTLARQPGLRQGCGAQARALVEREFSMERMAEEYRSVYAGALSAEPV